MRTFIITISIDREQVETVFIDALSLDSAKDIYNRKGDWDYDVRQVHISDLIKKPIQCYWDQLD